MRRVIDAGPPPSAETIAGSREAGESLRHSATCGLYIGPGPRAARRGQVYHRRRASRRLARAAVRPPAAFLEQAPPPAARPTGYLANTDQRLFTSVTRFKKYRLHVLMRIGAAVASPAETYLGFCTVRPLYLLYMTWGLTKPNVVDAAVAQIRQLHRVGKSSTRARPHRDCRGPRLSPRAIDQGKAELAREEYHETTCVMHRHPRAVCKLQHSQNASAPEKSKAKVYPAVMRAATETYHHLCYTKLDRIARDPAPTFDTDVCSFPSYHFGSFSVSIALSVTMPSSNPTWLRV
ncbi:hypothetical protein EVAR_76900_1 [Eumeta japonica]|uniref:Uncharacterized protein n=1 Tax=Eumeta variegata TaxID=151549 RepID=A0A4C1SET5_EUMVA|nr:hypothetical protein EVAR_76900_1 [Eumeta japonica]